jgi:hypothetical protein
VAQRRSRLDQPAGWLHIDTFLISKMKTKSNLLFSGLLMRAKAFRAVSKGSPHEGNL